MKKFAFVTLALLLTFSIKAQRSFNASFIASPQISWISSDSKEVSSSNSRIGFGYGVEGDFFLGSENYAINTGITVSSTGGSLVYKPGEAFRFGGKMLPSGTKVEYNLKNLEIPLTLKMRTRDFNRTRFFAQFGFTNWLNIKTKVSTSDNTFDKESVSDEIRFFNIGLNVGGGIEYDLGGNNYLSGGLVFSNGFTDATSNKAIDDDAAMRALRFRLGFVF